MPANKLLGRVPLVKERRILLIPQYAMIEQVRQLCTNDPRVVSALMFGSFAIGEGDQFSDIEFALFFTDESFPMIDWEEWVSKIAPVELFFADDFGHFTAIFGNMIRGEFHFEPASRMSVVESWQGYGWFPSAESAILLDRTGTLEELIQPMIGRPPRRDSPDTVRGLNANFINMMLFGANVMERGEYARAWTLLANAHSSLLKLVRLVENSTEHWPTPSKSLEWDLTNTAYQRYRRCTADIDPDGLFQAYRETWKWGIELMSVLSERHGVSFPSALLHSISERFG